MEIKGAQICRSLNKSLFQGISLECAKIDPLPNFSVPYFCFPLFMKVGDHNGENGHNAICFGFGSFGHNRGQTKDQNLMCLTKVRRGTLAFEMVPDYWLSYF